MRTPLTFNGTGVEKNYQQAAIWFQRAAENGDAEAASYIEMMKGMR
ncbi:hypothetical protein [Pseudaminobacter soli (ex Li et al. 2025)]